MLGVAPYPSITAHVWGCAGEKLGRAMGHVCMMEGWMVSCQGMDTPGKPDLAGRPGTGNDPGVACVLAFLCSSRWRLLGSWIRKGPSLPQVVCLGAGKIALLVFPCQSLVQEELQRRHGLVFGPRGKTSPLLSTEFLLDEPAARYLNG